MSSEAGSTQCRGLIEAKENLIKALNSLGAIDKTDQIQQTLKDVYNELEKLHESRRIKESNNLNWIGKKIELNKRIIINNNNVLRYIN